MKKQKKLIKKEIRKQTKKQEKEKEQKERSKMIKATLRCTIITTICVVATTIFGAITFYLTHFLKGRKAGDGRNTGHYLRLHISTAEIIRNPMTGGTGFGYALATVVICIAAYPAGALLVMFIIKSFGNKFTNGRIEIIAAN